MTASERRWAPTPAPYRSGQRFGANPPLSDAARASGRGAASWFEVRSNQYSLSVVLAFLSGGGAERQLKFVQRIRSRRDMTAIRGLGSRELRKIKAVDLSAILAISWPDCGMRFVWPRKPSRIGDRVRVLFDFADAIAQSARHGIQVGGYLLTRDGHKVGIKRVALSAVKDDLSRYLRGRDRRDSHHATRLCLRG